MRRRVLVAAMLLATVGASASHAGEAVFTLDHQVKIQPARGQSRLTADRHEEFFLKQPAGRSLILVLECDQPHRLDVGAVVTKDDALRLGRGLALRYDAPAQTEAVRLPFVVFTAAPAIRYRVTVFDARTHPGLWREIEAEAAAWAILGP